MEILQSFDNRARELHLLLLAAPCQRRIIAGRSENLCLYMCCVY